MNIEQGTPILDFRFFSHFKNQKSLIIVLKSKTNQFMDGLEITPTTWFNPVSIHKSINFKHKTTK